jgi:hypothetical protein
MSESSINVTPGSGGPNVDLELVDNGNARQVVVIGDPATASKVAPVDAVLGLSVQVTNQVSEAPATQCQSVTGATGAAVTATLPAIAGQFHYITFIQIKKYFTVANAASATPLVVTTTNLPGSLGFTFGQPLGVIGGTDEDIFNPANPLKSSVVNTLSTIICPATTGIIWRINVLYFTAP